MFKNLLISLLLLSTQINASIIEVESLSSITAYAKENSLVLCNVSGTMHENYGTFADKKWWDFFIEHIKKNPRCSDQFCEQACNKIFRNRLVQIPKNLIEEQTPELLSSLQEKKVPLLGITQKRVSTPYADNFAQITKGHLLALNIDFSKTLAYYPVSNPDFAPSFFFVDGILFTQDKPVGPPLIAFLEKNCIWPEQVIMVDNSLSSLEDAQESLSLKGIGFIGLRFKGSDAHRENFDPVLGSIQFLSFFEEDKLLTDEEALEIKLNNSDVDYTARLDDFINKNLNILIRKSAD